MNSAILIFAILAAYPLGPNFAAGPGHWNADVHAPQTFYPTELNLIAEPKEQPQKRVKFEIVDEYGNVIHQKIATRTVYAPDGSCAPCNYGQPAYYQQQQAGFWQRGPARRWLSNRGGWIRNGNHPILRFLFRRRG